MNLSPSNDILVLCQCTVRFLTIMDSIFYSSNVTHWFRHSSFFFHFIPEKEKKWWQRFVFLFFFFVLLLLISFAHCAALQPQSTVTTAMYWKRIFSLCRLFTTKMLMVMIIIAFIPFLYASLPMALWFYILFLSFSFSLSLSISLSPSLSPSLLCSHTNFHKMFSCMKSAWALCDQRLMEQNVKWCVGYVNCTNDAVANVKSIEKWIPLNPTAAAATDDDGQRGVNNTSEKQYVT